MFIFILRSGIGSVLQTGVVLEELDVHLLGRDGDVPDDTAADEAVLDAQEVGALLGVVDGYVVELEVQELVDADEGANHCDVVLELDPDFTSDKSFEERIEKL